MNGLTVNIKAIVEEVFECPGQLETRTRKTPVPDARKAYSKLCRKYIKKISYAKIGVEINKDHATVMNHIQKHEDLFTTNEWEYIKKYYSCEAKVKGLSDVNPVDYRESLTERVQMLSQEKCAGLLTLLNKYI